MDALQDEQSLLIWTPDSGGVFKKLKVRSGSTRLFERMLNEFTLNELAGAVQVEGSELSVVVVPARRTINSSCL